MEGRVVQAATPPTSQRSIARRSAWVGVIDTDIQSPGIHVLFGLAGDEIEASLNDFRGQGSAIEDVARDVTSAAGPDTPGRIHLIPSSMKPGEIARSFAKATHGASDDDRGIQAA